ncbi:MAG TPA: hypothetical protein VG778_11620 [Blastocatellia bacterium]|nr:hypothetical protein [Blastocatellia bacterium]
MAVEAQSILAIEASSFCRSLAVLPALRALSAAYPGARRVIAASRATCEVVAASNLATEVLDLGNLSTAGASPGFEIKKLLKLIGLTRRAHFDLVVDFSPGIESGIATFLGRHSRVVTASKASNLIDLLFGGGGRRSSGDHAEECARIVRRLGLEVDDKTPIIELPHEENVRFEQVLVRHGSKGGEPVVVLYGSKASWMPGAAGECVAEVSARLASGFGARIVAVDEPSSRDFTDGIAKMLPAGAIKLASPRVFETAAAVARASMVITAEPEVAYLTSVFGTPLLELRYAGSRAPVAKGARVVSAGTRVNLGDEAFEAACEMIQASRLTSLFQR